MYFLVVVGSVGYFGVGGDVVVVFVDEVVGFG